MAAPHHRSKASMAAMIRARHTQANKAMVLPLMAIKDMVGSSTTTVHNLIKHLMAMAPGSNMAALHRASILHIRQTSSIHHRRSKVGDTVNKVVRDRADMDSRVVKDKGSTASRAAMVMVAMDSKEVKANMRPRQTKAMVNSKAMVVSRVPTAAAVVVVVVTGLHSLGGSDSICATGWLCDCTCDDEFIKQAGRD